MIADISHNVACTVCPNPKELLVAEFAKNFDFPSHIMRIQKSLGVKGDLDSDHSIARTQTLLRANEPESAR